MAVVPRQRKSAIVYYVATSFEGAVYWERSGRDKREAERLDDRREREKKNGTYRPPAARTGRLTVRAFSDRWCATRTNRSADHDSYLLDVVLDGAPELAAMPLEHVRPRDVLAAIDAVKATGRAGKTVHNAFGVLRVLLRDAVIAEVIDTSPYVVPAGVLSKRTTRDTSPYTGAEIAALLSERVAPQRRAFVALAIWTGMRLGEICGRRWSHVVGGKPLDGLTIETQYDDEPLKGDDDDRARPRRVPIHPELRRVLRWWYAQGFAETYGRPPTRADFIVPSQRDPAKPYVQSGGRKVWIAACEDAGVSSRGAHICRHTFVTAARRATSNVALAESLTHNASGQSIDTYNHWQWGPLCEVINALRFDADFDDPDSLSSIFAESHTFFAPAVGLEPYSPSLISQAPRSGSLGVRPDSLSHLSNSHADLPSFALPAADFDAGQAMTRAADAALGAYLRALADELARPLFARPRGSC